MYKSPSLNTILSQPIKISSINIPTTQNDELFETPKSSPLDTIMQSPSHKVVTEIFDFIELRKNLKLLSRINENDKLTIINGIINIDQRYYFQGLRRWYTNDSRDLTKKFIEKLIRSTEYYIRNLKDVDDLKHLSKSLLISKIGIENLCITYNDDKNFTSILSINIEQFMSFINEINKIINK